MNQNGTFFAPKHKKQNADRPRLQERNTKVERLFSSSCSWGPPSKLLKTVVRASTASELAQGLTVLAKRWRRGTADAHTVWLSVSTQTWARWVLGNRLGQQWHCPSTLSTERPGTLPRSSVPHTFWPPQNKEMGPLAIPCTMTRATNEHFQEATKSFDEQSQDATKATMSIVKMHPKWKRIPSNVFQACLTYLCVVLCATRPHVCSTTQQRVH